MNWRLQLIISISSLAVLVAILNLVRKEKIELKYSLVWLLVSLSIFGMAIFPGCVKGIALLLGIAEPMNAIFFIGSIFQLLLIYSLTMALSRQGNRIRKIAQEIAIREHKSRKE